MAEGWIVLNRQIQEHWLWRDEPYDKARAWIDLLLLANHEDKKVPYKGKIIICERGTVNRSIASLAERWHWGREKTRNFLRLLESDQMVVVNATTNRTTITIVNYSKFQNLPATKRTTNRQRIEQRTDSEPTTNNNDNNDNNISYIVGHLNEAAGKNFSSKADKTIRHIQARLNEGFTKEDFVSVIDKKVADWKDNPKMEKYLRPETLFGTKFEGYLNEGGSRNDTGTESILSKPEYHIPSIHEDGTYW